MTRRVIGVCFFLLLGALSWGCKGSLKSNQNCIPQCAGKDCGSDGCGGVCGTCGPGTACSTDFVCVSSFCGNARVDPGEKCDYGITAGTGSCDEACVDDMNSCTTEEFFGNATDCDATCRQFTIVDCVNGDGCCPAGCSAASDSDCSANCDNGSIDDGETCDPPSSCPTEEDCDDGEACTADSVTGAASTCSAQCANIAIEDCINDDGCCPAGCGVDEDNDCEFICGDGLVTGPELCDNAIPEAEMGFCPTDIAMCDDAEACTTDALNGMADDCSAECVNTEITACVNGDGCCPANCTPDNDDDCMAVCGNGLVENPETCDSAIPAGDAGACPADVTACDDADVCTTDAYSGAPATCDALCTNTEINMCINGDGCCYFACAPPDDDDCNDVCTNYCTTATTNCVGGDALFTDDDMSGDAMGECMTACLAYTFQVGVADDPDVLSLDTLWCRIKHLELAVDAASALMHCPHGLEMSAVCNM